MSVLLKVLGMTVAGVLVIVLYLSAPVFGALMGAASPMNFMIYLGLLLTVVWTSLVMYLASTGGSSDA